MVAYKTLKRHYKTFRILKEFIIEPLWDIPYKFKWSRRYIFYDFYPYYWNGWTSYIEWGNGPQQIREVIKDIKDKVAELRSDKWQRDIMNKFLACNGSKLLEWSYTNCLVRNRESNVKYFRLRRYIFNYFKLTQTQYLNKDNKPKNTFMNFTMAILGGECEELIPKTEILFSGWVNNKSDLRTLWRIYRNAYKG